MATQRYYPSNEADQIVWLTNYGNKLPVHGPVCGLTAGELADTELDLAFYVWLLQTWNPAIRQDALEATAYKGIVGNGTGAIVALPEPTVFPGPLPAVVAPGVLTRLFNQVARIKLSPGHTEAIGLDLQIVGVADSVLHPVPEFKVKIEQGATTQRARLDFSKYGHEGVHIESRRNGGAWEFLGVDTEKPYLDERPLLVPNTAETREYRMRYWDKGEANGDWSPVYKVTVGA